MSVKIKNSHVLEHVKIKTLEEQSLLLKQLESNVKHSIDAHGRFGRKPRLMSGTATHLVRAKSEKNNDPESIHNKFEASGLDNRFGRKTRRMSGIDTSSTSEKHQDS
jgi:hypothetical protein